MLGVLNGLIGTLLGAWLGAYFGYRYSVKHARIEEVKKQAASKDAYLRHLADEFSYNRRILMEVKKEMLSGPAIDNLWTPAATAVTHLRLEAWDELVRAGILPLLEALEQQTLGGADRATRDAKRVLQTFAAKWQKVKDWQGWDALTGNPQPLTSQKVVKDQWLSEATGDVERAIYLLTQAISSLPSVTDGVPDNMLVWRA